MGQIEFRSFVLGVMLAVGLSLMVSFIHPTALTVFTVLVLLVSFISLVEDR